MITDVELIALLLNDSGIVRGVITQTAFNQQVMQFTQSRNGNSWLAKLHTHACHRIQHPSGNHRDWARTVVHMDNTSTTALFAISIANLTPVERMPAIVNFEFCTDMGRMSVESPSAVRTTCLQDRTLVENVRQRFIAWWGRPS